MINLKTLMCASLSIFLLSACSTKAQFKEGANLEKASAINVQLGSGYIARGQLELAKKKLDKAIMENPENALAYGTLAILNERTGKMDEAEQNFEKAISLDAKNSDIQNNYGTFLCKRGKFDEAIKHFEVAINDPFYKTPYVALANAGNCAMHNGEFDRAEAYLRKSLRLNSTASNTLLSMGELGVLSKKYLMARAYLQRYHAAAKPSPGSLWLQIQAENALGDKNEVNRLGNLLNKNFPDSDEAGKYLEIKEHERISGK